MNNRLPDTSCRAILQWQWPQCKWHVTEKSCSYVRWLQSCLRVWHTQFHIYILWQKTTWIFSVVCRISGESYYSPWVLFGIVPCDIWVVLSLNCSVLFSLRDSISELLWTYYHGGHRAGLPALLWYPSTEISGREALTLLRIQAQTRRGESETNYWQGLAGEWTQTWGSGYLTGRRNCLSSV